MDHGDVYGKDGTTATFSLTEARETPIVIFRVTWEKEGKKSRERGRLPGIVGRWGRSLDSALRSKELELHRSLILTINTVLFQSTRLEQNNETGPEKKWWHGREGKPPSILQQLGHKEIRTRMR